MKKHKLIRSLFKLSWILIGMIIFDILEFPMAFSLLLILFAVVNAVGQIFSIQAQKENDAIERALSDRRCGNGNEQILIEIRDSICRKNKITKIIIIGLPILIGFFALIFICVLNPGLLTGGELYNTVFAKFDLFINKQYNLLWILLFVPSIFIVVWFLTLLIHFIEFIMKYFKSLQLKKSNTSENT